jgi:tetratricopeptide (TPR) repeat protein
MYVRTPKRFTGRQRRSLIPVRRVLGLALLLALIALGVTAIANRDAIVGPVQDAIATRVAEVNMRLATANAPPPTPTRDPTADLIAGHNFWEQGSVDRAVTAYEAVLPSVPNDVETYRRVTLGKVMQGNVTEALADAERTVTADPFSSDAWALRAWVLDWDDRPGEAVASGLHALELDPDNARAMAYLAEAYRSLGQVERAEGLIAQALEINPDSAEAYRARGLIAWLNRFDFQAALADFETAYALAPELSYIVIDIALIQIALGEYDAAAETLDRVLQVNPQNTQALYLTGLVLERGRGDLGQAATYYQRCIDYNPESIQCLYRLGRAQINVLQDYAYAAELLRSVIDLGSQNPFHWWWAGNAEFVLGNCQAAMRYLEPGYRLAEEAGDDGLMEDFVFLMQSCGSPLVIPTSAETPEGEGG